ncbi:hypothetical protein AALA90_15475 [Lachnospiraceae bacterium 38-10]
MKKKEMSKRIRSLEDQLRRMEGRRQKEVKVIQNMAQRLNLDLEELLHDSRKPERLFWQTMFYKDKHFICCPFCKNIICKDDKYCQYCGKPMGIEPF